MSQNLDKDKIRESIRKTRPQELLYVVVTPADRDSKKNALAEIESFIGKGGAEVITIKKLRN